ncbi:hypothetical protein STRIP9103_02406 [Streptomyces ipomoeae 91-03]|uniref:Uncharacterized protein n=1 Tax=Streptomyces ipomoeae 91-03 TaxID=698759 RepID=L1L918_9ACTN|nr:hypothetical protein STRIP9103_02406 [Streptomyces ipomoeae 91-03]
MGRRAKNEPRPCSARRTGVRALSRALPPVRCPLRPASLTSASGRAGRSP